MEIIPGVHQIPSSMAGNVYLLAGEQTTLVDTGMPGTASRILDYVQGLGRAPGDVTRIVLTHYHVDHLGSTAALKERTGAKVLAHPGDAPVISGEEPHPPPNQALMRVLFRIVPAMSRFDPVTPDVLLEDGAELDILGGATVVHVPGHTPGAIALHLPEKRLLICGDAIDNRGGNLGAPPSPFTVDQDQAIASIRRMAELDFDVLCPGHGSAVVGGAGDRVRELARGLG